MKFGVSIPTVDAPGDVAKSLESLGFDYIATGEHVLFHGECVNAFVTLAACAATTSRINLLSAATLAPVYPPILLAKMAANLQSISQGRFVLGLGIGGEFEAEFEAAGVPLDTRGKRFDEILRLLEHLSDPSPAEPFSGVYGSLPAGLGLQPALESRFRAWIAGRGAKSQARAAEHDHGWMPYMYSPDKLREGVATIHEIAQTRHQKTWSGDVACVIPVLVDADPDVARKLASERLSAQYGTDMSRVVGRYTLTGTPDEVRGQLKAYEDAGLGIAILQPLYDANEIVEFSEEWAANFIS